jgi:hypothetical protein
MYEYVSALLTATLYGGGLPYAPAAVPPCEGAHLRPYCCVGDWVSCRASVDVVESGVMC